MVAHPLSDGSYVVTLGDSLDAPLGSILKLHVQWWASFRFHAVVDADGTYYGDSAPPELLAITNVLEDAVRAFGASESPPQHGAETGSL